MRKQGKNGLKPRTKDKGAEKFFPFEHGKIFQFIVEGNIHFLRKNAERRFFRIKLFFLKYQPFPPWKGLPAAIGSKLFIHGKHRATEMLRRLKIHLLYNFTNIDLKNNSIYNYTDSF